MSPEKHPGAGHRKRLRDRFLEHGLDKFTDEEVLELLLTLATPRRDCKQQARQLMKNLGSLHAVLDAKPAELTKVKGVGPKNLLGLKLIPAVARRYLKRRLTGPGQAFDWDQASQYLKMTMGPLKQEVFRVMLLDGGDRVLGAEDLAKGTNDQAVVYPREVVARCMAAGARAVVLAHNHPSGELEPSPLDLELTRRVYYALRSVRTELRDHLIVGAGGVYSMAKRGDLDRIMAEYAAMSLE